MANTDINLRLVNHSNDRNNSEFVIFQKNEATSFEEIAVAWRVIQHLGQGDYHPFTYSHGLQVSVSDSWGNFTPSLDASPGQMFQAVQEASGMRLIQKGFAPSPKEIAIENAMPKGAINGQVTRSGKLLALKTNIAPGEKSVFEFNPTIWVGVVSQVVEGEVMDSSVISQIHTKLPLSGIASADIVITGGGPGKSSTPFHFSLENIKHV